MHAKPYYTATGRGGLPVLGAAQIPSGKQAGDRRRTAPDKTELFGDILHVSLLDLHHLLCDAARRRRVPRNDRVRHPQMAFVGEVVRILVHDRP